MQVNHSLSDMRNAQHDIYNDDLDGLFSFIGKIGKGIFKGAKGIFKGGKQIQQAETAIQSAQGVGPYTFATQGSPNQPFTGYNGAAQLSPAQMRQYNPQLWDDPNKGMPDWVIPAGIGAVVLVGAVLLTRK